MRSQVLNQLLLFGLFCLCGSFATANADEVPKKPVKNATVPEYVPFPFFDRTLEEELEAGPLFQPSTSLFEKVIPDEETWEAIDNAAPDPSSVLRPRYLMPEIPPQRNSNAEQNSETSSDNPLKTTTAPPLPKTAETVHVIAQDNPSQSDSSPLFEPIPLQANDVTLSGHFINNVHTCDGLTCGSGCGSGKGGFLHLGKIKRGRGYCDACGLTTCSNKVFNRWFVDGWVTFGSTMNFDWPNDRENALLHYNDRNGEVVMNQLYLSFGRKIDRRRNRFDFGGQIDLLYGTDYFATSSLNLETRSARYSAPDTTTLNPAEALLHWNSNDGQRRGGTASLYGLSLPQAYAEAFVPFHFGTTVRAGHFYSGMSLESAMSPQNFFYSHSYSFMYGSPTTLTGITATTHWTKRFSTVFGITQGWNVFDNPMDRVNYLGGVRWESLDKETALSFTVHTGKEAARLDTPEDVRTGYSLTVSQLLAKRLWYSLEHTLGYESNAKRIDFDNRAHARWCSIAQYLHWELNDQWGLGIRGEWFRDDGYSRIVNRMQDTFIHSVTGRDLFEVTFGVNWKPTRFVTIRPELRYDWASTRVHGKNPDGTYNGITEGIFNGNREMFSLAIDAIVRF